MERYYLHFAYCLCSSGEESACCAVSNITTHSWGLRSVLPDSGSHSASHISVTCTALAAVPQSTPVPCAHANSIPSAVLHLQKSRKKEDFYPPQIQCRVRGSLRLLVWGHSCMVECLGQHPHPRLGLEHLHKHHAERTLPCPEASSLLCCSGESG